VHGRRPSTGQHPFTATAVRAPRERIVGRTVKVRYACAADTCRRHTASAESARLAVGVVKDAARRSDHKTRAVRVPERGRPRGLNAVRARVYRDGLFIAFVVCGRRDARKGKRKRVSRFASEWLRQNENT